MAPKIAGLVFSVVTRTSTELAGLQRKATPASPLQPAELHLSRGGCPSAS